MTATLPLVLRTHADGRFAVAVTARNEDGSLVLLVQESLGERMVVTTLSESDLVALLALVRGE